MARLSDMVALMEEHRVDTGSTLNLFARRLREAGRISKAGRGRGAASMTFTDASRFAIGCFATDHPEQAPIAEAAFSATVLTDIGIVTGQWQLEASEGEPFDRALAKLLQALSRNEPAAERAAKAAEAKAEGKGGLYLRPQFDVEISRSGVSAAIRGGGSHWIFHHPKMAAMISAETYLEAAALEAEFNSATLPFRTGKNVKVGMDARLLYALADLVGPDAAL
ncbi:hypothetical protein [Sphingomonas sp. 28-63-12]|uniref:hypothetical protein n=1 Tax=Sphingomonas sp. 28-63-12 TaxID=1970434 RepID=UPI0035A90160